MWYFFFGLFYFVSIIFTFYNCLIKKTFTIAMMQVKNLKKLCCFYTDDNNYGADTHSELAYFHILLGNHVPANGGVMREGGEGWGGEFMRGWGVVWSAGVVGRESGSKNSLVPLLGITLHLYIVKNFSKNNYCLLCFV